MYYVWTEHGLCKLMYIHGVNCPSQSMTALYQHKPSICFSEELGNVDLDLTLRNAGSDRGLYL